MEDDLEIPFGEDDDNDSQEPAEERTSDNQGGDDLIPEGFHDAIVLDIATGIGKSSGKPYYKWTLNFPKAEKVLDNVYTTAMKGKTAKGGPIAWLLKQALEACGIDVHSSGGKLEKKQVMGKKVRVKIEHRMDTFGNSGKSEKITRFESPVKGMKR